MKKLIFLLSTITFGVVIFLSIKQFELMQFQQFNDSITSTTWNVQIKSGNPKKSRTENFQLLEQMAIETKVNFQRSVSGIDKNNDNKIVHYVAFFDNDQYFNNIKLKTGKFLDENSDEDEFLSTINTHSKNQIGQLEIFHSFDPIEIRPITALEKVRDIKGTYTVDGKENAEKLKNIASKYGFVIEISKEQGMKTITPYRYENMLYKASIILSLLIALAMLYDVINNYKEIAVRYLLGHSFWQIGFYLLKRYIKIFLCSLLLSVMVLLIFLYFYNGFQELVPFLSFGLKNMIPLLLSIGLIFIVAWLVTKTINISQMIKNKKPTKLLFCVNIAIRFVLAIFLTIGLIQGGTDFTKLKNVNDKQEKWAVLKDYSYLGGITDIKPELLSTLDNEKKQQFQDLYKKLESQGAIYISPSSYYMRDKENTFDSSIWGSNGKRVEINKNYLSVNPIIGIDDNAVKINEDSDSNEITILVPEQYQKYQDDIKNAISKDYIGIYDKDNPTLPNINIIYVKNNQSYFSFSTFMAEDNNYEIIDPIAIVVNSKFTPSRVVTSMIMGHGYYTKNNGGEDPFSETKDTIKKYDFNDIFEPISVAYSNVELNIANNQEALGFTTIYCVIFIILAGVLLFFSAMYYLEMNKQLLAVQWIFGYSFIEKHYLIYLGVLVFWSLTFGICSFRVSNTILLAKAILALVIFDSLLMTMILSVKEINITKKILVQE